MSCHVKIKLIQILRCLHRTDWIKTRSVQKLLVRVKFTGNSYSYSTCVNVNELHWNTRKLVFTRTRTRVPHSRTRTNVNTPRDTDSWKMNLSHDHYYESLSVIQHNKEWPGN